MFTFSSRVREYRFNYENCEPPPIHPISPDRHQVNTLVGITYDRCTHQIQAPIGDVVYSMLDVWWYLRPLPGQRLEVGDRYFGYVWRAGP